MSKLRARLLRNSGNIERGEASLSHIVCALGVVVVVGVVMCNGAVSLIQWQNSEQQHILIEQPERGQE